MHPENVDLMSLCGIFKPAVKGVTVEEMKEAVRPALEDEDLVLVADQVFLDLDRREDPD